MLADRSLFYLGPEGTFTHQATGLLEEHLGDPVPLQSVAAVVREVEVQTDSFGLVPIENSVEGVVSSTVDEILFRTRTCMVREEVVVPVTFDAFSLPETHTITTAISHPHALAQCKRFVSEHDLRTETAASTGQACKIIAEERRAGAVALASPLAGSIYGLTSKYSAIEDNHEAHTKFYLLSKSLRPFQPDRSYETWVAVVPPSNRVGVLAELLGAFADRAIGLESISSRPLRAQLGAYCFLLNVRGWFQDPRVRDALGEVVRMGCKLRLLGSFPKWEGDGVVPTQLSLSGLAPGDSPAFASTIDSVPIEAA